MRYIELLSGVRMPISEEEQALIDLILESEGEISHSKLDERQQELARLMVSRGSIEQRIVEKELFFKVQNEKLTRF
jgi:hypothetical protein